MCRELSFPHPDFLLDILTEKQLAEWEAYHNVDPIGEERADIRTGIICSTIVNIAQSIWKKKGTNPKMTNPVDFIPKWDNRSRETKKQTVQEMKQILQSIASLHKKK